MSYAQELAVAHQERIARMASPLPRAETIGEKRQVSLKPISNEMLQDAHKLIYRARVFSVAEIKKAVAEYFDVKELILDSDCRTVDAAYMRHIAMYLCDQHTSLTNTDVGRRFGDRDRATAAHGIRKIARLMRSDADVRADVEAIQARLMH